MLTLLLWIGCRAAVPEPATEPAPTEPEIELVPAPKIANGDVFDSRLRWICDGSAAVRLADGGMVVAYDEDTRLHRYDGIGSRHESVELAKALGLPEDRELDLEGAAVVQTDGGPVAWWVGSHGLNADAEPAPSRRVFFATHLPGLELVGPSIDLVPVLRADPTVAGWITDAVLARAPKEGGLNIEALGAHPDGGLIVGLRSPLVPGPEGRLDAVLVHLNQVQGRWTVSDSHRVDLGGRGFRDLAAHGTGWLAIAGPSTEDGDFALMHLDASYAARPIGDPAWIEGLRPEALIRNDAGWVVFSDDGKVDRPDAGAKDGERTCDKIRKERGAQNNQVYFRLRTFPMPEGLE